MMFEGIFTALVTPFEKKTAGRGAGKRTGKVDYTKLKDLIKYQIAKRVSGIVVCATTGEAPTLTEEEKIKIIKESVRLCRGKIDVIAYTGTNDTRRSIEFTKMAALMKVNGALVVTPYYNKPSQEGIYQHFEAVAESTRLPIILYNVPSRTVVSINPETIARLNKIKNIVAVKEAVSDMGEIRRLKRLCDITILSGEDALTYEMMTLGAKGVVSVLSNITPVEVGRLIRLYNQGLKKEAERQHKYLLPLSKALFLEPNPVPVKTAMKILGKFNSEVRMPLVPMARENLAKLKTVLKKYKPKNLR